MGGKGDPLVFVHGWGVHSRVWEGQLSYFSHDFRVYAFTLPGHGDMPPLGTPLTIEKCGELLAEFLTKEKLFNAHLAGWSLGSQVVCHAARFAPDRLRSLSLIGGTPCFTAPAGERWGTLQGKARWFQRSLKSNFREGLAEFISTFFDSQREPDRDRLEKMKGLLFGSGFPPDEKSALELLDDLITSDIRPLLPSLATPSFILHGARDRIIPSEITEVWKTCLRSSVVEVFPDCGHAPFLSMPEKFNDTLKKHLTEL